MVENLKRGNIEDVNNAIESSLTTIQLALAAYQLLQQLWIKRNPEGTFEQFHAYLVSEATGMGDFSRQWFTENGYTQQPDGTYAKS